MDISSELVHCLLPIFMAGVLGASMLAIGIVEGIAEATAAIAKVFSGATNDRFRRHKMLVVLGYGLGAISKPAFPLASTIDLVVAAPLPAGACRCRRRVKAMHIPATNS